MSHLAASRNTLLLFDVAEDLFVSRSIALDELVASSRVFIHRLPVRMAVPVIWTANAANHPLVSFAISF
jgi:hypothetical protein